MKRPATPSHTGQDDANGTSTALRGAFLAYQKTIARPATIPTTNKSGALIAATSASRDHSQARSPSPSRQTTYNSAAPARSSGLGNHRSLDPRSPSLIAATLAASRSESPNSPKAAPSTQPNAHHRNRRGAVGDGSTASSVAELDLTTDSSSIGPTNAIISFFEQKEAGTMPSRKGSAAANVKKRLSVGLRPITPPMIMSPVVTYTGSPSVLASPFAWEKMAPPSPSTGEDIGGDDPPLRRAEKSLEGEKRAPPPPPARKKVHVELVVSTTSPHIDPTRQSRPSVPPTPKSVIEKSSEVVSPQSRSVPSKRAIKDPVAKNPGYPESSLPPKPDKQYQTPGLKPTTPSARSSIDQSERGYFVGKHSSSGTSDTFVSASTPKSDSSRRKTPSPLSPEASQPSRPPSGPPTLPSRPPALRPKKSAPQIPLSSLTNAILAGSLASARATPSVVKPLTPPPQKTTPHLRQTLRPPRPISEDDSNAAKHLRKRSFSKLTSRNKHAHHEAARKRWREEITARERQRYEGVWASNRGLLLDVPSVNACGLRDMNAAQQLVANAVVRDIWARSRLPFDELAEVWDLVDTQSKGVLDKAEFVVGMWLIDQRLRGRKIPRKVSESVWGSAKGVRVMGPGGKR